MEIKVLDEGRLVLLNQRPAKIKVYKNRVSIQVLCKDKEEAKNLKQVLENPSERYVFVRFVEKGELELHARNCKNCEKNKNFALANNYRGLMTDDWHLIGVEIR
jgi:hypothetical protein